MYRLSYGLLFRGVRADQIENTFDRKRRPIRWRRTCPYGGIESRSARFGPRDFRAKSRHLDRGVRFTRAVSKPTHGYGCSAARKTNPYEYRRPAKRVTVARSSSFFVAHRNGRTHVAEYPCHYTPASCIFSGPPRVTNSGRPPVYRARLPNSI